jgi:hypothetical protein
MIQPRCASDEIVAELETLHEAKWVNRRFYIFKRGYSKKGKWGGGGKEATFVIEYC